MEWCEKDLWFCKQFWPDCFECIVVTWILLHSVIGSLLVEMYDFAFSGHLFIYLTSMMVLLSSKIACKQYMDVWMYSNFKPTFEKLVLVLVYFVAEWGFSLFLFCRLLHSCSLTRLNMYKKNRIRCHTFLGINL